MTRLTHALLALFAAQLLLTVWAFWPNLPAGSEAAQNLVFDINPGEVDRIIISDKTHSVVIDRTGEEWRLPEYHSLPVSTHALESLLTTLPQLQRGYPVADSHAAKQRFELAPAHYQRQLQYFSGEKKLADLYLGTSPGFRKVHARLADEDEVLSIEFNSFDAPTTAAELLDKSLLKVTNPQRITGLDFQIRKDGNNWLDTDLNTASSATNTAGGATNTADGATVEALVSALANLRVISAVDIATAAILADTPAPPILQIESQAGNFDYYLYEIEAAYYAKRSDIEVFFDISRLDYDRLNKTSRIHLFSAAEDDSIQTAGDNPTPLEPPTQP